MNCSLSSSSVRGIFQARILEWVAISFSRGSSWPRDRTCISCVSYVGRRVLYQLSHQGSLHLNYSQFLFVVSHLPQNLGIWKMGFIPSGWKTQFLPPESYHRKELQPSLNRRRSWSTNSLAGSTLGVSDSTGWGGDSNIFFNVPPNDFGLPWWLRW